MTVPLGQFWNRRGAMFVKADSATIGPTESYPAMHQQGYGWVALDPTTGDWQVERRLAAANALDVVVWTRVRDVSALTLLEQVRKRWGAKAILPNLESPDVKSLPLMQATALALSRAGRGAVITDGWRNPDGEWGPLRRWIIIPEAFPEVDIRFTDVAGCVEHAAAAGIRESLPALGAYGTDWKGRLPVRSDYNWPLTKPWIVYPGDTVADWSQW